ncbi:MAG: hypothetical protein HUJ68_09605 [Clostridia bacterium]|nr:hypothetical protein [Clostridia bacterium]
MGRSRRRRKHKSYTTPILLIFLLIVLMIIINNTYAKYSSTGKSDAMIDVAFFVFEETQISKDIALSEMVPGDLGYEYNFSVANYNEKGERAEIAIEYEISLRMTTNLPLQYKLYKNGGEDDLFATITAQPDSDGTYFKSIKFPKEYFGFTQDEITSYKLVVSFPDGDRSADKQGIMEAIEIKINAKQRKE